MFNSTHTFVGLAIARTGLDDWVPRAALTAVIASNLPDIDILSDMSSLPTYIEYHRGITHSLVGIPVLSLALAGAMYIFTRSFWRTFLVALLAMATHPVLDYSNTYGLRPFRPFDGTWYYGDTLFIVDPIMDLILLLGIVAGEFYRKIRWVMSFAAIMVVMLYIGTRINARNEAQAQLDEYTARVSDFEKSAVLPRFMDLWAWDGIVETKDSIVKVNIDTAQGVTKEVARMPLLQTSKILSQAAMAPAAATLLEFARFPVARIQGMQFGYRVTFLDFRFYNEATHTSFAAEVQMDQSLAVTRESLAFSETID
jgi:inner membrane protein